MPSAAEAPGTGAAPAVTAGGDIDLVLFDIGGVLADFAGLAVIAELTGTTELEVAARWLMSPWVRRFEAGECSEQEFATGVVAEWSSRSPPTTSSPGSSAG